MQYRAVIFLLVIGVVPCAAQKQVQKKVAIEIVEQTTDQAGKRLTYRLRETIRKSHSLRLADDNEVPRLQILISTIDYDPQVAPGGATIYALIWFWKSSYDCPPRYLYDNLGRSGSDHLDMAAENQIVITDRLIRENKLAEMK